MHELRNSNDSSCQDCFCVPVHLVYRRRKSKLSCVLSSADPLPNTTRRSDVQARSLRLSCINLALSPRYPWLCKLRLRHSWMLGSRLVLCQSRVIGLATREATFAMILFGFSLHSLFSLPHACFKVMWYWSSPVVHSFCCVHIKITPAHTAAFSSDLVVALLAQNGSFSDWHPWVVGLHFSPIEWALRHVNIL